ncbi:hypothetical protein [Sulfurimonas sp.]|uniref:hypothetical protein n=1 Tax=Sulfurimonas sp. TaxID=2022749 RepID=UPI0025CE10DB|nr:hypothetical protein [Sulfurimonas sp.]
MCKLKNYIDENLPKVLKQDTATSLGDRSKYIGASDIGGCLRKAYLSKLKHEKHDIQQLIVFERGHVAETIIAKMLKGTPAKQQVEAVGKAKNGFPIRAHLDFEVDFGPVSVVIEAKSTSIPVDEPYYSWILQEQLQMGLLKNKNKGKAVRGYIVAIDVNTGWYKTFKVEPNQALYDIAMNRANILAEALVNKQEPEAEAQLYCAKCSFKGDCPAITCGVTDQLPEDVIEVAKKIASLNKVEKEIKALKTQLKDYMEATETRIVKADNHTVSLISRKGKKTVDIDLMKQMMPDVYSKFECNDSGYSYLKVV